MSTVLEVISLEGIDMEDTPPCQVYQVYMGRNCNAPSAFRVRSECSCGHTDILFVCGRCKILLEERRCSCRICLSPRGLDGYL
jgi:hypothetical protein